MSRSAQTSPETYISPAVAKAMAWQRKSGFEVLFIREIRRNRLMSITAGPRLSLIFSFTRYFLLQPYPCTIAWRIPCQALHGNYRSSKNGTSFNPYIYGHFDIFYKLLVCRQFAILRP